MKHTKWTRLMSLVTALCLMLTLLPAAVLADEPEDDATIDFVLLIDCSNTMDENDRQGLAREACKMFVDLIPIEDARVSIIAFGYEGEEAYEYEHFTVTKGQDAYYVHEISEMEGQLSTETKDEIKEFIDSLSKVDGQKTPIGAALAAGVDTLIENEATDGNACIIMMSDGEFTTTEMEVNDALTEEAPAVAKRHGWPIYCIEMDYFDKNEVPGSAERALLNQIVVASGAGEDGRMKVGSAAEVAEAFMKIFAAIWGSQSKVIPQKTDENGVVELEFEIPKLVSEATIAISGGGVYKIELENVTEGSGPREISGDVDEENLIVSVEDSYISVKMICPKSGTWKVRAYGNENAEIVWYEGIQLEMNLSMAANATGDPDALTKNDFIEVQTCYTYHDKEIRGDDIYLSTVDSAKLIVTNSDGVRTQFDMEATTDGYTAKIPVGDIPSGDFTVQVMVEHSMFRSGRVLSNVSRSFHSENLELIHHSEVTVEQTVYVNSRTGQIDLTTLFENPDGDPVTYVLSCVSDRGAVFEHTIDENDYLVIESGMVPGVYELEITAADPDMTQPLAHTIMLTVQDRPIVATQIPAQEVWVDYYDILWLKQDPTNLVLDLDLNDYFSDPDGVELVYGSVSASGEGSVNADITGGSVLHVEPTGKGDLVLSFTVCDGVSTITGQVDVEVVSGQAIYWKTYGIFYVIGLAALIAVLVLAWLILKNKRVKGTWDIRFEGTDLPELSADGVDISAHTASGRKSKFFLHELVTDLSLFLEDSGSDVMAYFDNTGADKIELGGVYGKKGCVILKVPGAKEIPDGVKISVSHGGLPVTKKTRVASGRIVITIDVEDEDKSLTIQLSLK